MNWVRKQKVLVGRIIQCVADKMITHPGDLTEASSYETKQDSRKVNLCIILDILSILVTNLGLVAQCDRNSGLHLFITDPLLFLNKS